MLASFIERISSFSEANLSKWLVEGITACHYGDRPEPATAFHYARASFGQSRRNETAEDELVDLYSRLDNNSKDTFGRALAQAVDKLPPDASNIGPLKDLISTGLRTNPDSVIGALTSKLAAAQGEVRRRISLSATFFLAEAHNAEEIRNLAQIMIDDHQGPSSASAYILVALCRHDPQNAEHHAEKLKVRFAEQMKNLAEAPHGYARFKNHLSQCIPNNSPVYKILNIK